MIRRFLSDVRGNFAILTGLAALPLFGAVGVGLDYSRASSARSTLQDRADEAVLSIVRQGPLKNDTTILDHVKATLAADTLLQNIEVNARWTSLNEYTVDIKGKMPLSVSQLVPGAGSTMDVSVQSIGRYRSAQLEYKAPQKTLLDPEAGDYNRVYAYCYNKDQKNNALTNGRSKSVAIADNAGSTYSAPMPICGPGETMSYQLYNSRNARSTKAKWDSPLNERYSYFTDTEFTPSETYNLDGWAILETVLCPSLEVCKPKNQGGILPYGKNRTPERSTEVCEPGKFMYYGWEDRPPGRGSSDRDYDDIRVIVECPSSTLVGSDVARLIK